MSKKVTAGDVAALAGVSRTAVSFVVNGRTEGNVSKETVQRVRDAAAQLGYEPDRIARSLRTQRTHVIGLLTDAAASSPFDGKLLAGAASRAEQSGYALLIADTSGRSAREPAAVAEFEARRVDGLVYVSMGLRRVVPPATRLPLTLANCFPEDASDTPVVVPAEEEAGRAAAQHLLDLGHRRVSMLTAAPAAAHGYVAPALREKGFRAAMRAAGVPDADAPILPGDFTIDAGYHAAVAALSAEPRPTALFAVNDRAATGALLAAARLGLDVPGDVSVIGFDDQEQLAANLVPALTTLALPHWQMGVRAVELLLDRMPGEAGSADAPPRRGGGVEELACELVIRESTAPPRHPR